MNSNTLGINKIREYPFDPSNPCSILIVFSLALMNY